MTIDSTNNPRPGSRAIAPQQDPDRVVMPPASPSSPQASPSNIPATAEIESAIKIALFQARSDLHLALRKSGAANPDKTWIDAFIEVAGRKFANQETPLCKMAQVFLHPKYLQAPHADLRKASEMVECVRGFFTGLLSHGNRSVKDFAMKLLERSEGGEMVKAPDVVAGKGLRSLEEALKRLEDPKASTVGLAALYKQLPDIFAKSFQTMRSATTEGEKRKIREGMDQAICASQKTRLYHGMSRQERLVFDKAISDHKRRLDSFTLQNGGSRDTQGKQK